MSSSSGACGLDNSSHPSGAETGLTSNSYSGSDGDQQTVWESGSQRATNFLQTLRKQNQDSCIFGDWSNLPPFSTATEPPSSVECMVTPFQMSSTTSTQESTESGGCSAVTVAEKIVTENMMSTSESRIWSYKGRPEVYSRKLFVGGLPIDIVEDDLITVLGRFGKFEIDWPRKSQSKAFYPPKGYVFLVFEEECSIHLLMDSCYCENDKYYIYVSSLTTKDKPAQVRPWKLSDSDFLAMDSNTALDPRKSVYLTGIPRPMKATELMEAMEKKFKGIIYTGIDTDPGLKYPSGAGRVAFKSRESYIAAISHKTIHIRHGDMDKCAFVTPYILDKQPCDVCWSTAPYFCVDVACLQYLCERCWSNVHMRPGYESHQPTVKEIYEKNRLAKARVWNSTS